MASLRGRSAPGESARRPACEEGPTLSRSTDKRGVFLCQSKAHIDHLRAFLEIQSVGIRAADEPGVRPVGVIKLLTVVRRVCLQRQPLGGTQRHSHRDRVRRPG